MARIAYIGNFGPSFSTESHVATAWEGRGHSVVRLQENDLPSWRDFDVRDCDLLLWTRTGWDWPGLGFTHEYARACQVNILDRANRASVPTVGYHLDRWWGLVRENEIYSEPFFKVKFLVTADGGHDEQWRSAGVNHVWLPPGVSAPECEPAAFDSFYDSDIAFVGSWNGYHAEWQHRFELVAHLEKRNCAFWPRLGQVVRGVELRALYASTKVNVGDSCLFGGQVRYWSDRIPETLGRGGFLLHPYVEGLDEHFTDGEHLVTWPLGDWARLDALIDQYLADEDARTAIAQAGKAHVLANHTYEVRVEQILGIVG